MRRKYYAIPTAGVLMLFASSPALGQPRWTPVGSTLDTSTDSYAEDPGIDPGVCIWPGTRAEKYDSSNKFRPGSAPLPPGAGIGSTYAKAELIPNPAQPGCSIVGLGSTKVTVAVEGQTLRVTWRLYSKAQHNCGELDDCFPPIPPGFDEFRAWSAAELDAQLSLLVDNVSPGTPVTLKYAWNVSSRRWTENEANFEDEPTYVEDTFLEVTLGSTTLTIYDGDYDFVDVNTSGWRDDDIGGLQWSGPLPVTIDLFARTGAEIYFPAKNNQYDDDFAQAEFKGELVMVLNGPLPPDVIERRRSLRGVDLEFSLDIGSDTELSDPNLDGDEQNDPGDVHRWNEPPRFSSGACPTVKDDALIFGFDPDPVPPNTSTAAPACDCTDLTFAPLCVGGTNDGNTCSDDFDCPPDPPTPQDPREGVCQRCGSGVQTVPARLELDYFDLDGLDVIDFSLSSLLWDNGGLNTRLVEPIRRFYSQCVTPPNDLIVSFDDDYPQHYVGSNAGCTVPVEDTSTQDETYGTAAEYDEILGLSLQYMASSSRWSGTSYGIRDETGLNPCLSPNPDPDVQSGEERDDDVDALAMHRRTSRCDTWLFSADHEAVSVDPSSGLPLWPGEIHEVLPGGGFTRVIDPCIHLGMPEPGCLDIDIDAFDFVWTPYGNTQVLTLLFSVDDDDILTLGVFECGEYDFSTGCVLDPNMIYASYLTGDFFPFLEDALPDDVDAITSWWRPLIPSGGPIVFFEPDRATIPAGESIKLDVFLQNTRVAGRGPLREYQMTFPLSATPLSGATGTLSDVPGPPNPNVDGNNPAWVFGLASGIVNISMSGSPTIWGAEAFNAGDFVDVVEPRYLGEVVYTASAGASGEFEIDIASIPIGSFLRAQNLDIPFTVKRPAVIRVDSMDFAPGGVYAVDGAGPTSVAMGDLDGDGFLDLAVANYAREDQFGNLVAGTTIALLSNNGSGGYPAYTSIGTGSSPREVAIADVDNDGDLDIAVANFGSDTASMLRNNGVGSFTVDTFAAGDGAYSVVMEDFDGDGVRDLAVANRNNNNVMVFLNTGAFVLTQTISVGSSPVIRGVDVDGDGDMDLVAANTSSSTLSLLLNDGGAIFGVAPAGPISVAGGVASVAVGDLDRDGDVDLVVANNGSDTVTVLINDGSEGFSTPPATYGVGSRPVYVTVADLNRDGYLDLAVANWESDDVTVLMNTGLGTFTLAGTLGVGSFPSSIAAGDVDGDNDLDLVVTNQWSDSISVLLNLYPSGNIDPSPAGLSVSQTYYISGDSTGIGWSWSVHGQGFNVWDLNAAGVPGGTADDLAAAFVASINSAGSPTVSASVNPGTPSFFTITANAGESFSLSVGAAGLQPANTVAPGRPFRFNPEIAQVLVTGADRNGNGIDDALEIATSASLDSNENGILDECEGCGNPCATGCFVGHGAPGCSDPACCNLICASDPYCCDTAWDGNCAGAAYVNCAGAPACVGLWECDDDDPCTLDMCVEGSCQNTDFTTRPCADDSDCFPAECGPGGFCLCLSYTGACCDRTEFTCQNEVAEDDCQGPQQEWTAQTRCADLPNSDLDGVPDCIDMCRGVDDAIFGPECEGAIPTVSEWGLIVLTLLLLAVGKVYFSRRRPAQA